MHYLHSGKSADAYKIFKTIFEKYIREEGRHNTPPFPFKLFSDEQIASLKKQAKHLKKANADLPQHQALDMISTQQGFNSWKALFKQNDAGYVCQQIHDHSVTMLFDEKDYERFRQAASNEGWWMTYAPYAEWLDPVLYKAYAAECIARGESPVTYDEYFERGIYDYLPIAPSSMPQSQEDALSFLSTTMKFSHFAPVMVIYQGKVVNLENDTDSELSRKLQAAMGVTITVR